MICYGMKKLQDERDNCPITNYKCYDYLCENDDFTCKFYEGKSYSVGDTCDSYKFYIHCGFSNLKAKLSLLKNLV